MVKTETKDTDKSLYTQLDQFLADSSQKIKQLTRGDMVEGEVVDINNGTVIVDVGYKSEGIVAGRELKSETLDWTTLKKGDAILVYVVKPEDSKGRLVLSIRRTQQASAWLALENAKKNNDVVDTTVVEANNGGLIVEIGKGIRGFIPISQLDATRVYANGVRQVGKDISSRVQKRLNSLIGEEIKTRIIELDKEKNKIILSEKRVTQARDLERGAQTLKKIKEGDTLEGLVSGITPFGIFVDAQGLEGLVHLSELSWDKVEEIGLTDGGRRVAYSVKRLQQDPWAQAISRFKIGDIVDGDVQKVVPYGAFVRIGEGLNGLIHISELSDKLVKDPQDIVQAGQQVKVKILSISSTERHLGLSLKGASTKATTKLNKEELSEAIDAAIEAEVG